MGYAEFELNIPEVMRLELPKYFDGLSAEPLTLLNLQNIPANAQGAYMLFLDDQLVYIGKTDAEAGFRNRLTRHFYNLQHRKKFDPMRVHFKAVRIFVFSNFDLETMLIGEYKKRHGRPVWNYSGFGSNDPGHNREKQKSAQFDVDYPVDIDREIDFFAPGTHELMGAILQLKNRLPYYFRYDTNEQHYTRGHPEMATGTITVPNKPVTTRYALQEILSALPDGWQVTVLPGRVILYKEHETYPEQLEILRRAT